MERIINRDLVGKLQALERKNWDERQAWNERSYAALEAGDYDFYTRDPEPANMFFSWVAEKVVVSTVMYPDGQVQEKYYYRWRDREQLNAFETTLTWLRENGLDVLECI